MPQVPSSVTISGRTSPMVIGQICHGSTGGSSRMACRVANGLARRGHIVHLFSREPLAWQVDPRVSLHAFAPAATECRTPLYRDWVESDRAAFTSLLGAAIEVQPFDVLHYHYARPFAGLVGGLVDGLDAPPPAVVGTLHGTDLTDSLGDAGALSRLRCELADSDALTTVSRDMYRRCSAALPSAQARLRIVPNFIEDQLRTRTRTPSVQPTILHVSNFRAVKDVGLLARLFVAVHERTGARLCLIGDGPELPNMRRFLDASVASAAVRYAGVTAHPEDHFAQATVLLSTSVEESFGLVLLEAMAAGLPVVARAVGGVPELVDDGVNGMLFNDSDFAATVERIVALLRSEDRLAGMRRAGQVRADHLRESRVIGAYEALYRDALVARGLNGEGRIA